MKTKGPRRKAMDIKNTKESKLKQNNVKVK